MLLHSTIAAGHAMDMSQSSVSRSISAMEQEVGFVLFTRDGNRMKPTVDAIRLFEIVSKMSDGLDEIGRTAEAIRSQQLGRIRIICLPVFLDTLVAKAVGNFSVLHPNLRFEVETGGMARVMDEVGTGRFELGIGASAEGRTDVRCTLIERRSIVAVAPIGLQVAQPGVIRWSELASQPFIGLLPESPFRQMVDRQFAHLDLTPHIVIEACNQRAALQMAECGAGVTLLDAKYAAHLQGQLQVLALEESMSWDCFMIFPRHEIAHHALLSFMRFLQAQVH